MRNTIADRMLEVQRTDWSKRYLDRKLKAKEEAEEAKVENASSSIPNTRPSHSLIEYAGKYSHPGYGTFHIALQEDSLFAHFPIKTFYLKHVHYDIFEPFEVTKTGIDTSDTGPLRRADGALRPVSAALRPNDAYPTAA